jgi:muramidase (phage lysozyme)
MERLGMGAEAGQALGWLVMGGVIPAPAHEVMALIRVTETGRADASAYETIFGHNETKLTKPITEMTINELQHWQPGFTKSFGSSASGAYQFMLATLKDLENKLDLTGEEIFNAAMQDRLGYELLIRRGYRAWVSASTSTDTFMIGLAKEWASFPVPSRMKGAHRIVERGQSYYAGDGLNKALVGPDVVWLACEAARELKVVTPPPKPVTKPEVPAEPELPDIVPGFETVDVAITASAGARVSVTLNGELVLARAG